MYIERVTFRGHLPLNVLRPPAQKAEAAPTDRKRIAQACLGLVTNRLRKVSSPNKGMSVLEQTFFQGTARNSLDASGSRPTVAPINMAPMPPNLLQAGARVYE